MVLGDLEAVEIEVDGVLWELKSAWREAFG